MQENLERKIHKSTQDRGCLDQLALCVIPGYALRFYFANRGGQKYDLRGLVETELSKAVVYAVTGLLVYYKYLNINGQ